jgi:hypothetical protein
MSTAPTQAQAMPFKPGSQNDLMLRRLKRARGAWVSRPVLEEASGSHCINSRAADLRKKGKLDVKNRTERVKGKCHSFYRLED